MLPAEVPAILHALLRDGSVFQPRPARAGADAPAAPAVTRRGARAP